MPLPHCNASQREAPGTSSSCCCCAGLQKSIQLRLKREGLLLPSLGYGSPQLLAEGRGTALLLR